MEEIVLYKNKKNIKRIIIYLTIFLVMEIFCTAFAFINKYKMSYIVPLIVSSCLFFLAYLYNLYIFYTTPNKLLVVNSDELTLYFTKKRYRIIKCSKIKDIKYYEKKKNRPEKIIIKIRDNEFKITEMLNGLETYKKIKKVINK